MKPRILSTLVLLLLLTGCAAVNIRTTDRPDIRVEPLPSPTQSVTDVRVYQQAETLVITGTVSSFNPFYLPGHVDIVLCAPDGSTVGRAQPGIVGHATKRGGVKTASFMARLPQLPPAGSTLRLIYHAPPFEQEAGLDCLPEGPAAASIPLMSISLTDPAYSANNAATYPHHPAELNIGSRCP